MWAWYVWDCVYVCVCVCTWTCDKRWRGWRKEMRALVVWNGDAFYQVFGPKVLREKTDECTAHIISPFLTTWKINIGMPFVYIRKMMPAELELTFKANFCWFSCSFYDTVLSLTMSCSFCVLIPFLTSEFLISATCFCQWPVGPNQQPKLAREVCLLFDGPIGLGHIIKVS